jgi:hypothetical protein
MTKGGINPEGDWVAIDIIPGGRLAATWRYLLCQRYPRDGQLQRIIDTLYRKHRGLQVYTDSFYPKGMQLMRHAGLYARNTKAKWAEKVRSALDALRSQFPLFDLAPFVKSFDPLTWRQRFKASFGQDPLQCPNCQITMELVEIWEPQRRYIWMKRWLETHRRRKAAGQALALLLASRPKLYRQLALEFF